MAIIPELAEFSDLVYEPNSTTATAKKLIAALNIGDPNATPKPTWSVLTTSSDPSNPDLAQHHAEGVKK